MKRLVMVFAGLIAGGAAHATDLDKPGNDEVLHRYNAYLAKSSGCTIHGEGKRVLLTGFGLFTGVDYNISGAMNENFADPSVWPDRVSTRSAFSPVEDSLLTKGILTDEDRGGRTHSREVKINGRPYSVCFLLVDVLWDFAGAVIAHEMERFQPDLVIMSGRGGKISSAVIESTARNLADGVPGFESDGESDDINAPATDLILPNKRDISTMRMMWDNQALRQLISPLTAEIGVSVEAPDQWSPSNDYICNNVSHIALSSAKSKKLRLAGGELVIQARMKARPKVGFFHYPAGGELTGKAAAVWAQVYASMIDQILNPS